MIRSYEFEELPTNVKSYLSQFIKELEGRGIDLNKVRLFLIDKVPMRLQEIIDDRFRDLELLGALVIEGKLVLICIEGKCGKSPIIAIHKKNNS